MGQKYKPSGEFSFGGVFLAIIIASLGGIAIGGLAHLVGRLIYLIVLFPLVMGFLGSMVVGIAIHSGKCRNIALATFIGIIGGVNIYASMHYFDYLHFRAEFEKAVTKQDFAIDVEKEDAGSLVDIFLLSETGSQGIVGYMKYMAHQGVSIGRGGRNGINIGKVGTYIYWLVECIIIVFLALLGAKTANDPFCSRCDKWYEEKQITTTDWGTVAAIESAIDARKYDLIPGLVKTPNGVPYGILEGMICPKCSESDTIFKVKHVSLTKKGKEQTEDYYESVIPFNGMKTMMESFIQTRQKAESAPKASAVS